MRYCVRCVMAETRPDLQIDDEGVCDACRSADLKESIDWDERWNQLVELAEEFRNKDGTNYDCVIPVSGGKDSTFQTYVAKRLLGLNPLCVSWAPCHLTEIGRRNLRNLQELGVDLIQVWGNPKVYRALIREGLKRVGDNCWPEHVGIFTAPVRTAVNYKIPLIIWGENSQLEYGGPFVEARMSSILNRRWLEEFGGLLGNRVEDMIGVDGIAQSDLLPYIYPSDEELEAAGVRGIFLGYYLKWDGKKNAELAQSLGFSVLEDGPVEGTYTNYENLDCGYMSMHDYLKYLKYGFGRATDHACLGIRNGQLTRAEGLELARIYEGDLPRKYLPQLLEDLMMTEGEFQSILDSFTNKAIFSRDEKGGFLRDKTGRLTKLAYDN